MQLPFVLSIPHCGRDVPADIRSQIALNDRQIAESVDFGTYEIFGDMPAAAVISARWSRLVADLNRGPDNHDPKGVVALSDYHARPVFKAGCQPDTDAINQRVAMYHRPYNTALTEALRNSAFIIMFDCHSLNGIGPADAPDAGRRRKDIILSNYGDHQGRAVQGRGPITCPPDMLNAIAAAFEKQGFSVARNAPYKGGYIINHYAPGLLESGQAAVQIEMNQALYMHPDAIEPEPDRIQTVKASVLRAFMDIAESTGT